MDNVTVRREAVELEIVIKFDVSTCQWSISGCDKNPVVALGMLEYALARVRRSITLGDLEMQMQNSPRVSLFGKVPA